MSERVTVTIPASRLPEKVLAKLSDRPSPGTRYRVTAEPVEETEDEELVALRERVDQSIKDPNPSVSGETVFAEARARVYAKQNPYVCKIK